MNAKQTKEFLLSGGLDDVLRRLYGEDALERQKRRYSSALDTFAKEYGRDRSVRVFSISGRSELSGNHTDHNGGCVIAAAVNLDLLAVASAAEGTVIRLSSEGYGEERVDFSVYVQPKESLFGTSASLIAGVCAGFSERGYRVGAFDAYVTSDVWKGSGLSSSAAFENAVGSIFNHLYNGGRVNNTELAQISQEAENQFFGKPCGRMDQIACAVGGVVAIDFADGDHPVIEAIPLDLQKEGYSLCIVNTGGSHADLTEDYASIPSDMRSVAQALGKDFLRQVGEEELIAALPMLRVSLGDRALLRAFHFLRENQRVERQKAALRRADFSCFLREVRESGLSSFCYLQNVYTVKAPEEQGLSLGLCMAEAYLLDRGGVCRVHGGGFGGTIQAFVPIGEAHGFRRWMEQVFGAGSCLILRIRSEGALCLL